MLNILELTTKWGVIFGGINEFNTFRGTTIYDRADTVNAEFPNASQQRIVVDNLYDRTVAIDSNIGTISDFYMTMARSTLSQSCIDDTTIPSAQTDEAYILKLISDMVAQGSTFLLPTVTIGGADTASATPITTLVGAPVGDGEIIGTVIDPATCVDRVFPYAEIIQFQCATDSYVSGVTAGNESFSVASEYSRPVSDALWPGGSGLTSTLTSAPSSSSTLFSNAYFEDWGDPVSDTPADWVLSNLSAGTTITRSSDPYTGTYAASFNAALINAEIYQTLTGLEGGTNYLMAFRYRRLTNITTGVVTIALRDSSGAVINNAAAAPLSSAVSVVGALGADYNLAYAVFSVPRGFTPDPRISLRFTTAMTAAESLLIDTVEFIKMTSLYTAGPDVAFLPGSTGWAIGDTYTFTVANNADNETFLRNIQRIYPSTAVNYSWPVDDPGPGTVDNALII